MKKYGIIAAMQEEMQEIKKIMTETEERKIYELTFTKGKINNTEVVLVEAGVGKVNAARTTQILINNFDIEAIINVGSAASANDELDIGDIVIGKKLVQHDFDITAFGHSKGYITGVGQEIPCDRELVSKFQKIIENGDERNYNVKLGIVASGDIFCTDIEMKNKINAKFDADVVDMECAALGQVCYLDNIPFISIRCVSDIPNGSNESDFDENLALASKRCANILKEFFRY